MAAGANGMKFYLLVLTLLSLTLHLLFLTSSFHLKYHLVHHRQKPYLAQKKHSSPIFDFLAARLEGKEIKIGLVNTHVEEENKWKELGETTVVHFDRVPKDRRWEEYFTDWVEEDEKWATPKCPDIPMPSYKSYGEFNVVVVKMPCGNVIQRKGIRDVFRLQVNLVAANLAVQSVKINGTDQNLFVVFIGTCGPMWEIFRCDDLLRHEGDFWIYKPELRRLKQKVLMPVGACQLAVSPRKHGDGKITYDFTKLSSPIDHPKEAYVTVLHTSEEYVCGAIVLAQSIVQTNSTKDLVLLADESITKESRLALRAAGWIIKDIERIRSPYAETYAYNEWNYSKLRIWQLTEYDKLIFIDSDFIVLENIDEFFVYPQLSAVRNDEKVIFNSGIMLIEPSDCIFEMLMNERYTLMSYNGGDQGFLNEAFTWWHRWPTRMNFLKFFRREDNTRYNIPKAIYTIHYLGMKPWMCGRKYDCNWDVSGKHPFASNSAHWRWWQLYDAMPKSLQPFCELSKIMDITRTKWIARGMNVSQSEGI